MSDVIELYMNNYYGQYFPQVFAEAYCGDLDGITQEDIDILLNYSEDERYLFAWEDTLEKAYTKLDGDIYHLYDRDDGLYLWREPKNNKELAQLKELFGKGHTWLDEYQFDDNEEEED